MRIVTLPGVYRPRDDTALLIEALRRRPLSHGARVLELCAGTGAVGLSLAQAGHPLMAVDVSRRAALTVRLNARLNGLRADVRCGDLFGSVTGERFDAIVANPPYVPAPPHELAKGPARAWNAGADGRAVLDRICAEGPRHLRPGGVLYIVQSSLAGLDETLGQLRRHGLRAYVVASERGPLGPIAATRREYLERAGHHQPGADEEIAVVRAQLSVPASARQRTPAASAT